MWLSRKLPQEAAAYFYYVNSEYKYTLNSLRRQKAWRDSEGCIVPVHLQLATPESPKTFESIAYNLKHIYMFTVTTSLAFLCYLL